MFLSMVLDKLFKRQKSSGKKYNQKAVDASNRQYEKSLIDTGLITQREFEELHFLGLNRIYGFKPEQAARYSELWDKREAAEKAADLPPPGPIDMEDY